MKILHVIPSVSLVRGGPSHAVLEMIAALRRLDIDAEIATTNDDGDRLLDVPIAQKTEYEGVPIWFFPRFSPPLGAVKEFAFSAKFTTWLWNNISNYDVMHVHAIFSYPSTMAMAIARIKKVPYICRPIGQLCGWSLQQKQQKKKLYLDLIERANLKGSQALHFTSEQEREEVNRLNLNTDSFILPHGLSVPTQIADAKQKLRQQYNLSDNEFVILFLSRIHPKKGLDHLIPALGKLADKPFTFILAGNGDRQYELEVTQLLEQYQIKERTLQVGFVEGETKNLLLQGSDLFALTSYSENFGVALLEALAAGTPALVTPGVALSSLVQQKDFGYVVGLDCDRIVESIEHCLNSPSELKILGKQAREFVIQNYTWNSNASQLIDLYRNCKGNNREERIENISVYSS